MLIGISGYIGSGKDTVAKMIQECIIRSKRYDAGARKYDDEYIQRLLPEGRDFCSGWHIKKFAGKLKEICSLLTGIPVSQFELQSVKDSLLGKEWSVPVKIDGFTNFRPMTVREFLQKMGTDAMRNQVHPNIHVNALFAGYKGANTAEVRGTSLKHSSYTTYPNWIISDCRFPNEAQAIKDKGGVVIRVNRKYMCHDPNIVRPEHAEKGINLDMPQIRHSSETSLDNWEFDAVIENNDSLEILLKNVEATLHTLKIQ